MSAAQKFNVTDHVVVQTYLCRRQPTDPAYFEIHLARDADARTPRLILITAHEDLYDQALGLEASGDRVDAAWRAARRVNGRIGRQLMALRRRHTSVTGQVTR